MADLRDKQVADAKSYVAKFGAYLRAYYDLTNAIQRAADGGIVWDDVTLDSDPALKHLDASMIVAAEGLMNQLVSYMGQSNRRQTLEAITAQ